MSISPAQCFVAAAKWLSAAANLLADGCILDDLNAAAGNDSACLSKPYLFALTYEKKDTPADNQKYRCLLIREELLEQKIPRSHDFRDFLPRKPGGEQPLYSESSTIHAYTVYRLKTLQQLRSLWRNRGEGDRVGSTAEGSLVVGKLMISAPLSR